MYYFYNNDSNRFNTGIHIDPKKLNKEYYIVCIPCCIKIGIPLVIIIKINNK